MNAVLYKPLQGEFITIIFIIVVSIIIIIIIIIVVINVIILLYYYHYYHYYHLYYYHLKKSEMEDVDKKKRCWLQKNVGDFMLRDSSVSTTQWQVFKIYLTIKRQWTLATGIDGLFLIIT